MTPSFAGLSRGLAATLSRRTHDMPEHRVVRVAAAVVPYGGPYILGDGVYVGEELFKGAGVRLGVFFEGGVEVGYVGVVVLLMVEVHRLFVYGGFQGVVAVGQLRQLVSHSFYVLLS